jgi:hypothetical protein
MSQMIYDKAYEGVRDQLTDDVGDWIDQYNLAHMILQAIEEEYGTVTLEMAKDFWYRALEYHLPELFQLIARSLPDPANEE